MPTSSATSRRIGLRRNPLYSGEPGFEELIRLGLDPIGDDIVRRTAIRRIILEAAIMWRIVRGRDDNSVGLPDLPVAIVGHNRMRNDRSRRVFVSFCEHHLDFICRQDLKRGGAGRKGKRMRVDA